MRKTKLVCFDLDDTLTKEIDSVSYLCILNGAFDQLREIDKREVNGELHWIEADYHRVKLMKGLPESKIIEEIDNTLKPLKNIAAVVETLRQNGIQNIVVTAGPKQVAKAVKEKWGFDGYDGSDYKVVDGVFTGEIVTHIGDVGKIACLKAYCDQHHISHDECVAVGDGFTDIPLFEYCKSSIAINATELAKEKASYAIDTENLFDILQFII